MIVYPLMSISRTSGPSVAGLETTYSGGNGFSTSYNSQRWLNLYLSACKLLDLALALPPESLPQFQMSVQTSLSHNSLCMFACHWIEEYSKDHLQWRRITQNVSVCEVHMNKLFGNCVISEKVLPHYRYRWAFIPEASDDSGLEVRRQGTHQREFKPYVVRLVKLLRKRAKVSHPPSVYARLLNDGDKWLLLTKRMFRDTIIKRFFASCSLFHSCCVVPHL